MKLNSTPAICRASTHNLAMTVALACLLATLLSLMQTASAMPWEHANAPSCFKQWGEAATQHLNEYVDAIAPRGVEHYEFNEFGEIVSTHLNVQRPASDLYDYDNRYHWMWNRYYDGPYAWNNPLWHEAGVPQLRTFVRDCERQTSRFHWSNLPMTTTLAASNKLVNLTEKLTPRKLKALRKGETFENPQYRGYRVSACFAPGKACSGAAAAEKFCKASGYAGVQNFKLKSHVGPTRHMANNQICIYPGCDGFAWVKCGGAAGHHMHRSSLI